jgi:hypothetical protein
LEEQELARVVFDSTTNALMGLNTSCFERIANALELMLGIQEAESTDNPAVSISLGLPKIARRGVVMANFELLNDAVVTIPILTDNAVGSPVTPPAGDTFTVVSSDSSKLNAVVLNTTVVVNALVQQHLNPAAPAAPDLFITVSDSAGLSKFTQIVDILPDASAKAITLDIAHTTEVSQPVPTAPGP